MRNVLGWNTYRHIKLSSSTCSPFTCKPPPLTHHELTASIEQLRAMAPDALQVRVLGQSAGGRDISMLEIGRGPQHVLMWSQMHGDEPTHTAVLLDLLSYLQAMPQEQFALDILASCTLHLIPMLNPVGPQRRNAQGIDINRDARALATPEARILRAAVESIQPSFAFNLHDQSRGWTVGDTSQPAPISLMAPPLAKPGHDTDSTLRAKSLAVWLADSVRQQCLGAISRYPADYMPTAFGEWVQSQGVSTVLVEAGLVRLVANPQASRKTGVGTGHFGEAASDERAVDLVRLHFCGLLAALHGIATGEYEKVDPARYDEIPLSGEQQLVDVLLRGIHMLAGPSSELLRCDVAINVDSKPGEPTSQNLTGTVVDMGDLAERNSHLEIEGNYRCSAGGILFDHAVTPRKTPSINECERYLRSGVTSVIGRIDPLNDDEIDFFCRDLGERRLSSLPINLGFAAWCLHEPRAGEKTWESLFKLAAAGALAIIIEKGNNRGQDADESLLDAYLPTFYADQVARDLVQFGKSGPAQNSHRTDWLGWSMGGLGGRGTVKCNTPADILLYDAASHDNGNPSTRLASLRYVLVNGVLVIDDGNFVNHPAGQMLRRTIE